MKTNEKNPLVQGVVGVNPAATPGDYVTLWDLYFGQLAAEYIATEVASKKPTERDQSISEGLAIVATFTDQILEARNKAVGIRFTHQDPDVVAVQARFRHAFETKADKLILNDREAVAVAKWQIESPSHGQDSKLAHDFEEYLDTKDISILKEHVHSQTWIGVPVLMESFLYPDEDFSETGGDESIADFDLKAFPSILDFQEIEALLSQWQDEPPANKFVNLSHREAVVWFHYLIGKNWFGSKTEEAKADQAKFSDTGDLSIIWGWMNHGQILERTLVMDPIHAGG